MPDEPFRPFIIMGSGVFWVRHVEHSILCLVAISRWGMAHFNEIEEYAKHAAIN